MEPEQNNFYAIELGLKKGSPYGKGCESFKKNKIINCKAQQYQTLATDKFDVFQQNCIDDFNQKFCLDNEKENKDLLLAGAAGGAGTIINWVSQQTPSIQNRVKGLVVEAVAVDNEFAIHYGEQKCNLATYLPFARLWIPLLAKTHYPTYNPFGTQPIEVIKDLPKDLPVIIMHAKEDPVSPINGALKLYVQLKKNGNPTYLFLTDTKEHLNILDHDTEKKQKLAALQSIYKNHQIPCCTKDLLENKIKTPDLAEYQPTIETIEKRIHKSTFYPKILRNTVDISAILAIFLGCYISYSNLLFFD